MHYYQHNIGDFASATRLLGPIEIGIAQILIDEYARTEKPLGSDFVNFVSQSLASRYPFISESLASGYVSLALRSLFVEKEGGYVCPMLDEQVEKYAERAERNRKNASKPRKKKINPLQDKEISESLAIGNPVASQSLTTNNQEPITINQINNPLTPLQGENAAAVVNPSREEKKKAPARDKGTRLEVDALPDEWRDYCLKVEPELDPQRVFEDFRDYWRSLSGAKAIKTDWRAVWQTHVRSFRNAPEWKRNPVLKKAVESKDDYLPNSRFKTQEARLKNDDYGLSEIFGEGWK